MGISPKSRKFSDLFYIGVVPKPRCSPSLALAKERAGERSCLPVVGSPPVSPSYA